MSEQALITQEMREVIGIESEPWTVEVDKTSVRMFARAVGYSDPVFYDEEEAKRRGYRSLPAPPAYLGTPVFNPARTADAATADVVTGPQRFQPPLPRILNGGTEVEYFGTICAGDVLTARSRIADIAERTGSIGQMVITTTETAYRDPDGTLVAVMRGTIIYY